MTPQQSNLAKMSLYVTLLICQFTLDYIESRRMATLKMMGQRSKEAMAEIHNGAKYFLEENSDLKKGFL